MNEGIWDRGLGGRCRIPIQEDTPHSRVYPDNSDLLR